MNYLKEWLKSLAIEFNIGVEKIHITLLFIAVNFCWINRANLIKRGIPRIHLCMFIPKYGFVITNKNDYIYKNMLYRFYKKHVNRGYYFYVLHVEGKTPKPIEDAEDKWDK